MKNEETPLISCLCVTKNKPKLLKRAISCFLNQTYTNKELIVVYDDDDFFTKNAIKDIKHDEVFFFEIKKTKSTTLGDIRNYSIAKSKGEYICQWDDDDWYHIGRIEYQYEAIRLTGFPASILTQWLIFDCTSDKAYASNRRLWEGSLLCNKNAIEHIEYDRYDRGEDTSMIHRLLEEQKIYQINDVPNLYVYTYHGENTWDYNHWSKIFEYSRELDLYDSKRIKGILEKDISREIDSLLIDEILQNPLIENDKNTASNKIPKTIHLTSKSKSIPEKYSSCLNRIYSLHPNWEIIIYDDDDAHKIIEDFFPEIINIYRSYPCDIQRVDLFRLLIVYLKGGFYLDLDVFCLKDLDELCTFNLVLGEERQFSPEEYHALNLQDTIQIANFMFGSVPKHPFWIEVLLEAIVRSQKVIRNENDILFTTGPWLLTKVYQNTSHKYNDITLVKNKFRLCLSKCKKISCRFGDYTAHLHLGSWRWQNESNNQSKPNTIRNIVSHSDIEKAYTKISKRLNLKEKES